MKKLLLGLSLLAATFSAIAGNESLRSCNQPANGMMPEQMPWLPNGANKNACNQMFLNAKNVSQMSDKVVAFKDGRLIGVRDTNLRNSVTSMFDSSAWQESATIGPVGELWWGRAGDRYVVVGQEAYIRQYKGGGTAQLSKEEIQDRMAEFRRQAAAMKNHEPPPPPLAVPDRSGLFTPPVMEYKQISVAMTTFAGDWESTGKTRPGKVANARLKLETKPFLRGELSFDLMVEGINRHLSFPVMHNVRKAENATFLSPEQKYRLRGAAVVNNNYYRCEERPSIALPGAPTHCEFPGANFKEVVEAYEAYGTFLGDQASLSAIQFQLTLKDPERPHLPLRATGLIILQDQRITELPSIAYETDSSNDSPAANKPDTPPTTALQMTASKSVSQSKSNASSNVWVARADGADAIPIKDCPMIERMSRSGPEPVNSPICNDINAPIDRIVEECSISFQKQVDLCNLTRSYDMGAKIVFLTSTQPGCPACISTNQVYKNFAKKNFLKARGSVWFMQFTWNPWTLAFSPPVNMGITNFEIRGLPTILALNGDKIVGRINGTTSVEDIEKLLSRVSVAVAPPPEDPLTAKSWYGKYGWKWEIIPSGTKVRVVSFRGLPSYLYADNGEFKKIKTELTVGEEATFLDEGRAGAIHIRSTKWEGWVDYRAIEPILKAGDPRGRTADTNR